MNIRLYQVDAFTDRLFSGNPAAVCPLTEWLADDLLQAIALENNLSETAYFVPFDNHFELRWFTPAVEVDLCGHATLASAHILFRHLQYERKEIHFETKSGALRVQLENDWLRMDFPQTPYKRIPPPERLIQALGVRPIETYFGVDFMVILADESELRRVQPDMYALEQLGARGVIITAKGNDCDFVSRFFAPAAGVPEDPVTGSTHTMLTPFWAERLGKNKMLARQLSRRGGEILCEMTPQRVLLKGKAVTYMVGEMRLGEI